MKDSEIWLEKKYAEIKEVKLDHPNSNGIRIYCTMHPNVFNFQIRTYKPITEHGDGKPRNMIAQAQITIEELERLLARMKEYSNDRMDRRTPEGAQFFADQVWVDMPGHETASRAEMDTAYETWCESLDDRRG